MRANRLHARVSRGNDLRLVLHAYVVLIRLDVLLRRSGFQRVRSRIDRVNEVTRTSDDDDIRRARHYARRIENASHLPFARDTCLYKSLTLHAWLRRQGFLSQIVIGVSRDDSGMLSHAWVELDGHVVNDDRTVVSRFSPLRQGSTEDGDSATQYVRTSALPQYGERIT